MSQAGLYSAGLAVAVATVLAACGSSAPNTSSSSGAGAPPTSSTTSSAPAGGLTVHPAAIGPRTAITFDFVAPRAAGRQGRVVISYGLQVTGPARSGCVGAGTAQVSRVTGGRRAELVVGPQGQGGWCGGAYLARVQEVARPYCKPGQMCPQYVRVVATVATARFSIASS